MLIEIVHLAKVFMIYMMLAEVTQFYLGVERIRSRMNRKNLICLGEQVYILEW